MTQIAFKKRLQLKMKRLIRKQLDLFLDPFDEEVIAQAEKDGINQEWITAAQNFQCINWQ